MEAYLGVDGGGTRTRSLLVSAEGAILGRGLAGASNPQHCSEAELTGTLQDVVNQALTEAGDGIELTAACFGLAGSSNAAARHQLTSIIDALAHQPKHGYCLETDARVALTGAFDGGPGCLLILGTGSVCLGQDDQGAIHRTGGWGSIADDGGSAGWIGRKAIETAVRQADGRAAGDAVRAAIFAKLGITCTEDIIPLLHGTPPMSRTEIAALCPIVMDLAERGDGPATDILNGALNEAIALIDATQGKLRSEVFDVTVVGGLPESNPFFSDRLRTAVAQALPQVRLQRPHLPAVAGAVLEAYRLYRKQVAPGLINGLKRALA